MNSIRDQRQLIHSYDLSEWLVIIIFYGNAVMEDLKFNCVTLQSYVTRRIAPIRLPLHEI